MAPNIFNYSLPLPLSFSTLSTMVFILLQYLLSLRLLFLSTFLIFHSSLPNIYLLPLFLPFLSDVSLSFSVVRLLFICFCKPLVSSSVSPFLHHHIFFRWSIIVTFSFLHVLSCVILYYSLFCLLLHLMLRSVFCCLRRLLRFSSFCRPFISLTADPLVATTVDPLVPTWFFISACLERQSFLGRWFL